MRKEKQYLLDDIKSRIENSKAFIVTHYKNMSANAMVDFRSGLSKVGGDYEVIAKRVFLKATENQGIELSKDLLEGHIGIAFSEDDYVSVAKEIHKYSKENKTVEILTGYIEGQLYDQQSVIKLSELPSLDEMRAQFAGLLEAPMSQTLGVFDALLTSVIYCLENKAKL
ncbi:MAG: 50S ribosomal protein L10 [Chlamydiae bacterium]|nr:50S ribosomal protein L10 [Chlamydiota bacterium]